MVFNKIDNNTAEIKFYGEIGYWFQSGDAFTSCLNEIEEQGYKSVNIRLHSYGGSVFEGNVIRNALARTKLSVSIYIDGVAASMACMILPAVKEVYIAKNAFGMVHCPISMDNGNAQSHAQTAKLLQDIENNFINTLSKRTGKSAEEIRKMWFDGNDHWLNADEMIEYGLAKQVFEPIAENEERISKQTLETMDMESVYNKFMACLKTDKQINQNNNNMYKKKLIDALRLEGVNEQSSDEQVSQKIEEKVGALNSKIKELEAKAEDEKKKQVVSAVEDAITRGVISKEAKDEYEKIGLNCGLKTLNSILGQKTGGKATADIDLQGLIKHNSGSSAANDADKDWDWYQKNDVKALEMMAQANKEAFNALYFAKYALMPE